MLRVSNAHNDSLKEFVEKGSLEGVDFQCIMGNAYRH